ncbi:hypothetical protein FKM82_013634 [Ascaphus truei]
MRDPCSCAAPFLPPTLRLPGGRNTGEHIGGTLRQSRIHTSKTLINSWCLTGVEPLPIPRFPLLGVQPGHCLGRSSSAFRCPCHLAQWVLA